jgi:ASC-1-like (ASCH) protein
MKILYLTLKKKWFDLIKSGEKKTEYREVKSYWEKRLLGKKFDRIIFTNGYSKTSPKIEVECKGIGVGKFDGKDCYAIKLGKVFVPKKAEENKKEKME